MFFFLNLINGKCEFWGWIYIHFPYNRLRYTYSSRWFTMLRFITRSIRSNIRLFSCLIKWCVDVDNNDEMKKRKKKNSHRYRCCFDRLQRINLSMRRRDDMFLYYSNRNWSEKKRCLLFFLPLVYEWILQNVLQRFFPCVSFLIFSFVLVLLLDMQYQVIHHLQDHYLNHWNYFFQKIR